MDLDTLDEDTLFIPSPPTVTRAAAAPQPKLPPFTLSHFLSTIHSEQRGARQENRDRWTTPGLRPLAEPPYVDWEVVAQRELPSKKRVRLLFPNSPERRARFMDLVGERTALWQYTSALLRIEKMEVIVSARRKFRAALQEELWRDYMEVNEESISLYNEAGPLERFEYVYLDPDLGTTKLEEMVRRDENAGLFVGVNIDPEINRKYGELFERVIRERDAAIGGDKTRTMDKRLFATSCVSLLVTVSKPNYCGRS